MAFWKKKSEDPWDHKPEKKPAAPVSVPEPPAWAQVTQPPEPIVCPWCGEEMLSGNLYSGGQRGYGPLEWREGTHKSWLDRIGTPKQEQFFQMGCYEEAWYCAGCRKMVVDVGLALQQQGPNYEWKDGKIVFPEESEE
jgi:sarcosine oxidase delta subunit